MITAKHIRVAIHANLKKQADDTHSWISHDGDCITYDGDINLDTLSEEIMRVITATNGKPDLSNVKIGEVDEADRYVCDCHRLLGNDFYFLPMGSCLHDEKPCKERDAWRAANPVKP